MEAPSLAGKSHKQHKKVIAITTTTKTRALTALVTNLVCKKVSTSLRSSHCSSNEIAYSSHLQDFFVSSCFGYIQWYFGCIWLSFDCIWCNFGLYLVVLWLYFVAFWWQFGGLSNKDANSSHLHTKTSFSNIIKRGLNFLQTLFIALFHS